MSAVAQALSALGVQRLQLSMFDTAFPGGAYDSGVGTPYSRASAEFLQFVRNLGFNSLQLGPQGLTSLYNPSPYDGTLFSRSVLNADAEALVDEGLLPKERLQQLLGAQPKAHGRRADYRAAHRFQKAMLLAAFERFQNRPDPALAAFETEHRWWLLPDGIYEALSAEHEGRWHEDWDTARFPFDAQLFQPRLVDAAKASARLDELANRYSALVRRYAFEQWVVHRQHQQLRATAGRLGLTLFGDLQVGLSPRDAWARGQVFLHDWRMGAPPSRTTKEGQPWGYRVLDPDQARLPDGSPGPAMTFLGQRLGKMYGEFDGVRIDHPHGLVCPWVYQPVGDQLAAVQGGARLYGSPDRAELRRFAIAREDQLNRERPRYADDWERALEPEQVDRYAQWMDEVVRQAKQRGQAAETLACEVLSTCPLPLLKVLQRHGMGRFRVAQKANLDDPRDVYRSENAQPEDLVMLGNHDTPPIWQVIQRWQKEGQLQARADYLSTHLTPPGQSRAAFAAKLAASPNLLAQACLADLFVSPAKQVLIFFTDLFGFDQPFNVPGLQSEENWSLRLTADDVVRYGERAAAQQALSIPQALAMALEAKQPGSELLTALR